MEKRDKITIYVLAALMGLTAAAAFICGFLVFCIVSFNEGYNRFYLLTVFAIAAVIALIALFIVFCIKMHRLRVSGYLNVKIVLGTLATFVAAFIVVYCVLGFLLT